MQVEDDKVYTDGPEENILGKIRDDEIEVSPGAISIVLESLDHIKELIEYLSENGAEPEGSDEVLVARLNAYAEGKGDEEASQAAQAAALTHHDHQQ